MPDFDVDFSDERRQEVIDYVSENMVMTMYHKLSLLEQWQLRW